MDYTDACNEAMPAEGLAYAEKSLQAGMQIRKPTKREQLMFKRERLAAELANVTSALNALDDHPDLEKFLEIMSKV